MSLTLILSGDAAALAPQVHALLERLGPIPVEEIFHDIDEGAEKGNRLAVTALVLMLPSTIIDTMTLIDRTQVVQQVRELLAATRNCDGVATLKAGDNTPLDLFTASVDDVMNAIAASGGP